MLIDRILNKVFYKFNNFRIFEKYIYRQDILKNCPKNFKKKVFFRIYICRKNKILISLIPKNANTSIRNFFNNQLNKKSTDNYFYTKLLSNNFKGYTKVIFFREPTSRYLSYYSNKIFHNEDDFKISNLIDNEEYLNRIHLAPQKFFILNDLTDYDIVGNIENLEPYISKLLKIKNIKKKYSLLHLNSSAKNQQKFDTERFLKFNIEYIKKIYKFDYELWRNIKK
tara:strand:- start:5555 stop:6229 length:675 start_codon:yes stop_codon:yes gene_type:complete